MGKMATALDGKLPEFQKYLLEKNLAPAKNVPFYNDWIITDNDIVAYQ